MDHFGFIEIILSATALIVSLSLYKQINRKNHLGELVYKIGEDRDSTLLIARWIVTAIIIVLILIINMRNMAQYLTTFNTIALPIVLLGISANGILKGFYNKELRKEGLTYEGKFFYWKDMTQHTWEEDRLEMVFMRSHKEKGKGKTIIWFINDEDMEPLKEILENIKKNH